MDNEAIVVCENGSYGSWQENCPPACPWFDSCKEYSCPIENHARVRNSVDYDKNHYRASIKKQEEVVFTQLGSILHYLVNLDDNTMLALIDIISNPNASQAEIARKRGVTRQRINTSLLHAVKRHPELGAVFCVCMNKITMLKNRYSKEDQNNQLELGFDLE